MLPNRKNNASSLGVWVVCMFFSQKEIRNTLKLVWKAFWSNKPFYAANLITSFRSIFHQSPNLPLLPSFFNVVDISFCSFLRVHLKCVHFSCKWLSVWVWMCGCASDIIFYCHQFIVPWFYLVKNENDGGWCICRRTWSEKKTKNEDSVEKKQNKTHENQAITIFISMYGGIGELVNRLKPFDTQLVI